MSHARRAALRAFPTRQRASAPKHP
jgi:hypothetical protein